MGANNVFVQIMVVEMKSKKATAADVALGANVSLSTVDRVLNDRGGVATEKEKRVLQWAKKLKLDRALSQRAARTLRIAVVLQKPDNPFHADVQSLFKDANTTYAALNLQFTVFHATPTDSAGLAATIGDLAKRYDGLIISAPQSRPVIDALRSSVARIPVITLATDIPESERHAYVGPDDLQAGRVSGDLMGRFLSKAGGNVLVVAGLLGMQGQASRIEGFSAVLAARFPQCAIAAVIESDEDEDAAGRSVRLALETHHDIRGVYLASLGARATTEVLTVLGRQNDIVLITHELTSERRKLVREGLIHAIIDQDPRMEVRIAVETMARLLARMDGEAGTTITPIHIHMMENA